MKIQRQARIGTQPQMITGYKERVGGIDHTKE